MPIWRLTPIDPNDPNWEASTYTGVVIVRAESEERARKRALTAFGKGVDHRPVEERRYPPWKHADLVRCERMEGSGYPEEGPEAILVPDWAEHDVP